MKPWFNNFNPISPWGWVVYFTAVAILLWDLKIIVQTSQSTSDIVFNFFPHLAGVFLLTAIIIKAKRIKDEK